MICQECKVKAKDGLILHPSTVYTMQYIISTEVEKLYTFTVSAEVLSELRMVMDRWRERYLEKNMKSLEILESVKDIC
jgi:DNA repair protein RecO (recombination protein O)